MERAVGPGPTGPWHKGHTEGVLVPRHQIKSMQLPLIYQLACTPEASDYALRTDSPIPDGKGKNCPL